MMAIIVLFLKDCNSLSRWGCGDVFADDPCNDHGDFAVRLGDLLRDPVDPSGKAGSFLRFFYRSY